MSEKDLEAVDRLKEEGVPEGTAVRLVTEHGAERCLSHTEAIDAPGAPGAPTLKNRSGWLVRAIRRGWEPCLPR